MISRRMRDVIISRTKKIPVSDALRLNVTHLDEGYCEMEAPRIRRYDGVFGTFHGGLLMTVADSAACVAIVTCVGLEAKIVTSDMNIRFLSPCRTGVTAKARVVQAGRTLCLSSVELFDDRGRQVAVAQVNYMVFERGSRSAGMRVERRPEAISPELGNPHGRRGHREPKPLLREASP